MHDVCFQLHGIVDRKDVKFLRTGGAQKVLLGSWINASLQEPAAAVEHCYEIIEYSKLMQFMQTEIDSFVELKQATWYPISSLL